MQGHLSCPWRTQNHVVEAANGISRKVRRLDAHQDRIGTISRRCPLILLGTGLTGALVLALAGRCVRRKPLQPLFIALVQAALTVFRQKLTALEPQHPCQSS